MATISGKLTIGIPLLLLHDAQGMIVTVEVKDGSVYRGMLEDSEDNFSLTLRNASLTKRDGTKFRLQAVYIRGGQVKLVIFPTVLKRAPYLLSVQAYKENRGKAKLQVSNRTRKANARGGDGPGRMR